MHAGNNRKNDPSSAPPPSTAAASRAPRVGRRRSSPATAIRPAPPPATNSRYGPPNASHTGAASESIGSNAEARSRDDPANAAPNTAIGRDTESPRHIN